MVKCNKIPEYPNCLSKNIQYVVVGFLSCTPLLCFGEFLFALKVLVVLSSSFGLGSHISFVLMQSLINKFLKGYNL